MDTEAATKEVARRFLTRYGPASREELAKWFGAPVARAGRAAGSRADEVVETEFGLALAADVGGDARRPSRPACVRLLPAFDQYVVAAPRDDRATTASRADLPARRVVLAGPAGRRRDGGGLVAARATMVTIEPFARARHRPCARPPRPRRCGSSGADCHLAS